MIIKTKYHGETQIQEEQIIMFANGLPGFSDEKKFVILPLSEDSPFVVLQSAETAELAFIVASPFVFFKDYGFDLDETTVEFLEIEAAEDVEVMAILTIEEPFEKSTANLMAPIVVNRKKMLGKQVILHDSPYQTKHLIGGESC
ncbi:flagellar assembly protein FliW [Bacillus glycinifermentans]|uniref:Flagellar assembly factor FliW n=1 Tax=Bacillus glycinifermentans TaxID=1664069 RepID=A0A0J6E5P0_9BACI|nr:flagellar assembly protein FliW [Bacillus glycinifermentans]ATH93434.1 flagellar assembly protein FliW [Bacillus glycinifermentans]KMM63498.1 flagellar assembly protein FliW [Bacillus glycinifermentans]KRT90400.1 flagellar biosynthesis protein FliW [Bacillus glycinifermentans]MEC0484104.1 flagellar assembly protein FliW [Bacillus glycinifermentans]MEC0494218.1 flagellar assembly protein FliW [Bacillus glycinifermentans]